MREGFGGQCGPQMAAAYPEAHHSGDRLSGGPRPAAVADRGGQVRHPVKGGVYRRDHVHATHPDDLVAGGPKGGVERGDALGGVHRLAVHHPLERGRHGPLVGQVCQQSEGRVRHLLARRVDPEVAHLDAQTGGSTRIVGQQLPEGGNAVVAVTHQGCPGGAGGRRAGHAGHSLPDRSRPWVIWLEP